MELEKMSEFFDRRLDGYEEHQLNCINAAREFYPYTASLLPTDGGCRVLDLGCGTGLELGAFFAANPSARVTGVDLAPGMLKALKDKFPGKNLELINASYFDIDFGTAVYDAAVSVESLHHFTFERKRGLYRKIHTALKANGYFILTDYFSQNDDAERASFAELKRLKEEQNIADDAFYHYDTPLTVQHELDALSQGGFTKAEVLQSWQTTAAIKAYK